MRPFRFSVQHHAAADGKAWRDLARKTEDLGYTTLYLPDHFGDQWSPTVAMTIAAEVTKTLRVGALVYDVDYRHPITQAKEVATLDLAFPGRTIFGFGAGWMKTDYDESGIAYDSPGTRIDRMKEALTIMKALWPDGTCTFEGEHYTITNAQGFPASVHARAARRSSSAAAARRCSPSRRRWPTRSASTRTWPPAPSAPRSRSRRWATCTASAFSGSRTQPAIASISSTYRCSRS